MSPLKEPYRLARYSWSGPLVRGLLYTCARPGRSLGSKKATICDEMVMAWIAGIENEVCSRTLDTAHPGDEISIVSLLGRKPTGLSEFSYYSFRGGFDKREERPDAATWQEWLNRHYGFRYRLWEFPTEDTKPVTQETKRFVTDKILEIAQPGKIVVLVDSGGVGRTGSIVNALALHS